MRMSRARGVCRSLTPWWGFSGKHAVRTVTVNGEPRTLIQITGNGTLTTIGDVHADVWMCGTGAPGGDAQVGVKGGDGGGGAYVASRNNMRLVTGPCGVRARLTSSEQAWPYRWMSTRP